MSSSFAGDMPKPRGRKRKPTRRQCRSDTRQRPPRGLDLSMLGPMFEADEAEHRGDARGALAIIEQHLVGSDGRAFWRPARIERLLQVAALEPVLPGWATSRWILDQALQLMDDAMREPHRRGLEIAVELRGGPQDLPGTDEVEAMAKVRDHDWVYRQLVLYEYGGLSTFLRRAATPDLVVGADHIQDWTRAPMRVLRFRERAEQTLTWTDLTSGDQVVVPNLGAAAMLVPGECALGRLVPTVAGVLFEGMPLRIPEALAAAAAPDPFRWLDVLRTWPRSDLQEDGFDPAIVHGNLLLTDVPRPISQLAVGPFLQVRQDGRVTPGGIAAALLDLGRALVSGVLEVADDGLDPWPCLAAELLAPTMSLRLAERVTAADAHVLAELERRLAGPAAYVCRELAKVVERAA
jgi:hypothetical protein